MANDKIKIAFALAENTNFFLFSSSLLPKLLNIQRKKLLIDTRLVAKSAIVFCKEKVFES